MTGKFTQVEVGFDLFHCLTMDPGRYCHRAYGKPGSSAEILEVYVLAVINIRREDFIATAMHKQLTSFLLIGITLRDFSLKHPP